MDEPEPSDSAVQWDSVSGWQVMWNTGGSGDFHHLAPQQDTGPQVWIHRPARKTLVLGSTQPDALVRHELADADGIEVCKRRSGGGLVFVDPETDCWIDVIVPSSSRLWDADVGRAFHWLGQHWAAVLAAPPLLLSAVVSNTPNSSPAGRIWCFADMGHGEVSVDGSKVVGLSQRRTKTWARLQSMVLGHWPADQLRRYVNLAAMTEDHPDRFPDLDALDPGRISAGLPPGGLRPEPQELAARFLENLPPP